MSSNSIYLYNFVLESSDSCNSAAALTWAML